MTLKTNRLSVERYAVVILACAALVYHAPLLLQGQTYYCRDIMHQHIPSFVFARQSLSEGRFPLWNPYQFSGMPFLADPGSQLLYPPAWLLILLDPRRMLMTYIILHYMLAGIFMYLLLRDLGVAWLSAVAGSIAFMFSGFPLLNTSDLPPFCAYSWIPLVLLLTGRAVRYPTVKSGVLLGLSSAVQLLSGNAQLWLVTSYLAIFFAVVQWMSYHKALGIDRLVRLILGVSMGLSVAAAQVLPSWELVHQSIRRGGLPYELASLYSLAPVRLYSILFPFLWGPVGWPEVMKVGDGRLGYAGVGTVVLAVIALALASNKTQRSNRFFALASIGFLLLALGQYSFLFPLTYRLMPGFSLFRAPVRYLSLFAFCLCVLAAFSLDSIARTGLSKIRLWLFVGGCSFLVGAIGFSGVILGDRLNWHAFVSTLLLIGFWWALIVSRHYQLLSPLSFSLLAILLTSADLFVFGFKARLPVAPMEILNFEPLQPIVRYLKSDKGYFRVYWPNGLEVEDQGIAYEIRAPVTSMYGISNVEGYFQLKMQDYELLWHTLPFTRVLEILNVKYILTTESSGFAGMGRLVFLANGIQVRQLSAYLPRVFVVDQWVHAANTNETLKIIANPSFNPIKEVILEEIPFPPSNAPSSDEPLKASVQILSYRPEEIHLLVSLSREGILVLLEPFYPGWRAEVDGQDARLLRADLIFRAVALPSGHHHVRVFFRPTSVYVGGAVSICGLISSLVVMLASSGDSRTISSTLWMGWFHEVR